MKTLRSLIHALLPSTVPERAVDRLQRADDRRGLVHSGEGLQAMLDAVEEMVALCPERLDGSDSRNHDVAFADGHPVADETIDELRSIVRDHAVVDPDRLREIEIIEHEHPLIADDDDLARLAGVKP